MYDLRGIVTQLFTAPANRNYLKQYFPDVPNDVLDNNLDTFVQNYDDLYGTNVRDPWKLVRKLNRAFVETVNFNPSTDTTFGSFGEMIFMNEEVRV